MSEYFYFKGEIHVKESYLNEVYSKIANSMAVEGSKCKVVKNTIIINTVDLFGSAPLSKKEDFLNILKEVQVNLSEKSTVEHYCFGDHYYHIKMFPGSSSLDMQIISNKDPYSKEVEADEIIKLLKEEFPDAEKMVKRYYEIILEQMLAGKQVETDFGTCLIHEVTREAREGRNPQTLEIIRIPSVTVKRIKFRETLADWVLEKLKVNKIHKD